MSIDRLLTNPCTLTLRSQAETADDGYGNEIPLDPPTVDAVCELQKVARRVSEEPGAAGELSDTLWNLFLPAGTVITTADMVTVNGQTFEMVGDPWDVRHPVTGVVSHVEATVRRTA
jgi:hypothetical protein